MSKIFFKNYLPACLPAFNASLAENNVKKYYLINDEQE